MYKIESETNEQAGDPRYDGDDINRLPKVNCRSFFNTSLLSLLRKLSSVYSHTSSRTHSWMEEAIAFALDQDN